MQMITQQIDRFVDRYRAILWQPAPAGRAVLVNLLIRLLRTMVLAIQGFARHHGSLRASALTFFTLLSLVPVAALAFGIAKGFGFERLLRQWLLEQFAAHQEVVLQVIAFAENLLENTRGGMIAGIGTAVLFWAVIRVLSHIETAFNHIWGVRSRTSIRKLSDYLTIMIVSPILVIVSASVTVYITHQVSAFTGRFELLQVMGPAIYVGLKLMPYALIWITFTLVYMVMPNTRVRFDSALLAGFIAGSAYQLVQAVYIDFQILVAKYNAIYGSFAALPLFLLWLQVSWIIVMVGAEISHAYQHAEHADDTDGGRKLSVARARLLAISVCRHVVQQFQKGAPAPTLLQIARSLGLPPALVDGLSEQLVKGNILVRVESANGNGHALQPCRDIAELSIHQVVTALDEVGMNGQPEPEQADLEPISQALADFRASLDGSNANRLIKEL